MSLGKTKHSIVIILISMIIFLLFSCSLESMSNNEQPVTPVNKSTGTQELFNNDMDTANAMNCERPYEDNSIWNLPVDWSKARIHPESNQMMNAFFSSNDWIGADTEQYAPNVYFVDSATPLIPVKLRKNRFRDASTDVSVQYGEPAGTVWMPLPEGARPANGTDGQLVVVNLDTGEEWGLNEGKIDRNGNWHAGGAYRYNINNSGIPPQGFGQRGAGIGQLAGIVRRCEVERGYIGHAVTLAYDYPCEPEICQSNGWPSVVSPFLTTDGRGKSKYDIPEGARIVIRPEITKEEIYNVCSGVKGCIIWTENMKTFGGFVVDNSGHPKTYAEGNDSANWDADIWFNDMLSGIPSSWYVVIDWNFPEVVTQNE